MNFSFRRTRRGDDAIIKQVIQLADANKKTLGFLPASVIEERCLNGNGFVCMQGDVLVGYILSSHLKRTHIIRIHHFCISKDVRRSGVAVTLFNEFKKTLHSAFYIELSCRVDYGIDKFWNKLGFQIVRAREGRAVNELSILHLFRCPLQKNLLDIIEDVDERPKVLLDASIIFDFDFESDGFTEKNSLLAFSNEVLFCVAPVIFEDMQRQLDEVVRLQSVEKVNKFKALPVESERLEALCSQLASEFPHVKLSDREQLACAITNNVKCFVTSDQQLLAHAIVQKFADDHGVMIYSPAEFYHNIDSVLNREVVQTELLPTTHGKLVNIGLDEADLCSRYLNTARGEKKYEFIGKLRGHLKNSSLKSIIISNTEYGILYYSVEQGVLTVHLLRTHLKASRFTQIAATFILGELIQIATRGGVSVIHLDDAYSHSQIVTAGTQLGFFENKKLTLRYVGESSTYPAFVQGRIAHDIFAQLQSQIEEAPAVDDIYAKISTERKFSPAKFTDLDVSTYVVPIRPAWAEDLITPQVIGQHGLLTSDTGNVLMNDLNVYYTGTKARISAPGRILWYMTDNARKNTHVMWTKHVIASSYLDEVHAGTKEEIFKKFWKIGVYKWADISSSPGNTCTAMLFSRTEIFTNKIPYKFVEEAIRRNMNKGFTAISATPVTKEVFFEIYEQGYKSGQA